MLSTFEIAAVERIAQLETALYEYAQKYGFSEAAHKLLGEDPFPSEEMFENSAVAKKASSQPAD